jgi:hypothetical protein
MRLWRGKATVESSSRGSSRLERGSVSGSLSFRMGDNYIGAVSRLANGVGLKSPSNGL